MDDITILRELRADVQPDPAGLQRARQLLERAEAHADGSTSSRWPRLRLPPWLARRRATVRIAIAAGLAAAVAGGVLAVESATVGGHPVGASATAAEALHRAANAALRQRPAPVPGPGQFLYRREVGGQSLATMGEVIVGKDGSASSVPPGPNAQHLCQSVHEEWQPTDPRQPVLIRRTDGILVRPGNGDPTRMPHDPLCQYGTFTADAEVDVAGDYAAPTPAFVAGLPTDPAALYERVRRDVVAGGHALVDDETLVVLTDLGRSASPYLTPQLTAAIFRATAMVPGVDYVGLGKDILGRSGTVVGRTEPGRGERREIVFDTSTGVMLGERSVVTNPNPCSPPATPCATQTASMPPVGTVIWQSAITTAVVDWVPDLRRSPTR